MKKRKKLIVEFLIYNKSCTNKCGSINFISKKDIIEKRNKISAADSAALIRIRLDPIYTQLTEKTVSSG